MDRDEQPADFGRERERLSRTMAQSRAETALGEAEPIERRRIEMPDAGIPRGIERRGSLLVRKRREQIAERGAAASEWSGRSIAVHRTVSFVRVPVPKFLLIAMNEAPKQSMGFGPGR